jgi:hypothetical protein
MIDQAAFGPDERVTIIDEIAKKSPDREIVADGCD